MISLVPPSEIEDVVCSDVEDLEVSSLISLGQEMIEFCSMHGGSGLSAPQIGIKKKMFVWYIGENQFQIVFNPKYYGTGKTHSVEGCLSYEKRHYYMTRPKEIQAVFYGFKEGKLVKSTLHLRGEKAVLFAHECDHVNYMEKGIGKTIDQLGELVDNGEN